MVGVFKTKTKSPGEAKGHSPGSWSRPMDRASAYLPSTSSALNSTLPAVKNDDLEKKHGDLWWFMMIYDELCIYLCLKMGYAYQIIALKKRVREEIWRNIWFTCGLSIQKSRFTGGKTQKDRYTHMNVFKQQVVEATPIRTRERELSM